MLHVQTTETFPLYKYIQQTVQHSSMKNYIRLSNDTTKSQVYRPLHFNIAPADKWNTATQQLVLGKRGIFIVWYVNSTGKSRCCKHTREKGVKTGVDAMTIRNSTTRHDRHIRALCCHSNRHTLLLFDSNFRNKTIPLSLCMNESQYPFLDTSDFNPLTGKEFIHGEYHKYV